MIRERMESVMMQDRHSMRKLFDKLAGGKAHINLDHFRKALVKFGVQTDGDEAAKVMNKFCMKKNQMSFEDFVLNFLGESVPTWLLSVTEWCPCLGSAAQGFLHYESHGF